MDQQEQNPATAWPVHCPVDGRWVPAEVGECPDCQSPLDALYALNLLAGRLLIRAREAETRDRARALVAEAQSLVPLSESVALASADALEVAGHPDLAAEQVESALRLAPRRPDLQARLDSLRATSRGDRMWRKRQTPLLAMVGMVAGVVALVLLLNGLLGEEPGTAGAPDEGSPTPHASLVASTPSPSPALEPTLPPAQSERAIAQQEARRAVGNLSELSDLPISIEIVEDGVVRVAGVVPDEAARTLLLETLERVTRGGRVNDAGLVVETPARYYYVQPGDTLSLIALRLYGDYEIWPTIAEENPGVDPLRLQIGSRLRVP